MKTTLSILVCTAALSAAAQSAAQNLDPAKQPLASLASVDLDRYQGVWHQIALYPNRFQKSCASNTRATYSPLPSGLVKVTNQCRGQDGKEMQAEGFARPAATATLSQATNTNSSAGALLSPAQLQVRFAPEWLSWLPMVWGNYWVIQLAPDYRYAVVGEPQREFLWVLAREQQLASADWATIESRLKEQGYDPSKLVREKHAP